jgi:8-amino-7-oxononanoate synthase
MVPTAANAPAGLASELGGELARLEAEGLRRRRRVLETPQGAHVRVDGREFVSFCSNDYLGLAADPRLVAAAQSAAARHGVGAGASHLVCGHGVAHHALEAALAAHVGYPQALLFSSGYMANIGVVTALCGREDEVFADKLNHASLNDAVLLSRATMRRYAHCDLVALEKALATSKARRRLVVTDAVFSMDGDIAPLDRILDLCERHDAWLLVDDAHGLGVLGDQGAGTLAHFAIASPRIVLMGTLGKAAGVAGAFVAAHPPVVEYLVNRARTYIYTTAMPPLLAEVLCASIELVRAEQWRRERLAQLVAQLRAGLAGRRWALLPSSTPIQPLVIGDAAQAMGLADALAQRGLLVPAIRPPTVPRGTARLRISLSAAHSGEDVGRLVDALDALQ